MEKIYIIRFVLFIIMSFISFNPVHAMKESPNVEKFAQNGYKYDTFSTQEGRNISIIFIKHGSIAIDIDNYLVYIDPVSMFGNDFSVLPKADLILVTHEHQDHLDAKTISTLSTESTKVMTSRAVAEKIKAEPLSVGQRVDNKQGNFIFVTMPAYNITEGHLDFHPKSRGDVGFVISVDGFRIYVAGDTEDIPEMAQLADDDIDVAFLPVNQPFTMTPEQAIHAIEMIKPHIVYPYHFGQTDLTPIVNAFAGSDVDIRLRALE